jgi:hypothetical protein
MLRSFADGVTVAERALRGRQRTGLHPLLVEER